MWLVTYTPGRAEYVTPGARPAIDVMTLSPRDYLLRLGDREEWIRVKRDRDAGRLSRAKYVSFREVWRNR